MKVTSIVTIEIKETTLVLSQHEARNLLSMLKGALGELGGNQGQFVFPPPVRAPVFGPAVQAPFAAPPYVAS